MKIILILCMTLIAACTPLKIETEHSNVIHIKGKITNNSDISYKIKRVPATSPITIHIESQGGSFPAMISAIKALKKRTTLTTMVVRNYASSAAANLLCYADKLVINDGAYILFHSVRANGEVFTTKTVGVFKRIVFGQFIKYFKPCAKYLTRKEIYTIIVLGKDIILTGKEFKRRIRK